MSHLLRAFVAPAEKPGWVSRIHKVTHNHQEPQILETQHPLLAPMGTRLAHGMYTYKQAKHTYT